MKRIATALIATTAFGIAFASPEAEFAAPVMGYVHDSALGQVRPLVGTPGAATAPSGVAIGEFEHTLVSRDGSFAIVSSKEAGALRIFRFGSAGVEATEVADVPAWFDKVALGPAGKSAAVYARECSCVRVVTGLPSEPKLIRTVPLGEGVEVRGLAVSDAAEIVALATEDARVLLLSGDSPASGLALPANALTIDGPAHRLLAVDTEGRKTYLIPDLASPSAIEEVDSEAPVAAAFGGNSTVLIADASAGVIVWNPVERTSRGIECLCRPTAIEPVASPGMYRLSKLDRGAVWLLDMSGETPRTFFVPVRREAAE